MLDFPSITILFEPEIRIPEKVPINDQTDQPNSQLPTSKRPHTNIKEVRNKTFSSDSVEVRLSKLRFEKILYINPTHKKLNLQKWAREIDRIIRFDHRSSEDIRGVIEWCQSDPFWQNSILSTAKLREKYDQLSVKIGTEQRKKAESVLPPVQEIICPRCKRELVVRNQLYGGGCSYEQGHFPLRNDRHLRRGIPYLKVSTRSVRYKTEDVIAFMERQRISF